MFIRKKNSFYWHMMDARTLKNATVVLDLEYDVLDRQFHSSIRRRSTPAHYMPGFRPSSAAEKAIAIAQLSPEEIARCMAESINPSIWTRARKAVSNLDQTFTSINQTQWPTNLGKDMKLAIRAARFRP